MSKRVSNKKGRHPKAARSKVRYGWRKRRWLEQAAIARLAEAGTPVVEGS